MVLSRLEPALAPVRPRVGLEPGGVARLLEEEVETLLAGGRPALVRLEGRPGSGRTTALRHVAAVLGAHRGLRLLDQGSELCAGQWSVTVQAADAPMAGARRPPPGSVRAAAARAGPGKPALEMVWELLPWSDDDCLEYLMNVHPRRVAAAFGAWRAPVPAHDLRSWPGLCRAVLDHLAVTATATPAPGTDALCALAFVLQARLGQRRAAARDFALRLLVPPDPRRPGLEPGQFAIMHTGRVPLGSRTVRDLLAAEALLLAADQQRGRAPQARWWPAGVVAVLGHLLATDPALLHRLHERAAAPARHAALLLSVLCAAIPELRPPARRLSRLAGARLCGIDLSGRKIVGSLDDADLTDADLRGATFRGLLRAGRPLSLCRTRLDRARLDGVVLGAADARGLQARGLCAPGLVAGGAVLAGAVLREARLADAVLQGADLRGADLTDAVLARADLRGALLHGARLAGTDLSCARLDRARLAQADLREAALAGAVLTGAQLGRCRLDGVQLPDLLAERADLTAADLTAARLPRARLGGAVLARCGLADIDLQRADLRGAVLAGATFHLGNSRSGHVGSTIAGEGSRTGFYTDESLEQHFAAPEDVRKANLRGCDLRGADLTGVDLYLVDLRGAILDDAAREHARRCRAILR